MRFTFINPNRFYSHGNIWSIVSSITPPLGIATLSAVLEQAGNQTQIIDALALNLTATETIDRMNPESDFAAITVTTPQIKYAAELAQKIRRQHPHMKIIMGGVHPTVFHRELVSEHICDMAIRNEGEEAMRRISAKVPLEKVENLTWKDNEGRIRVNPDRKEYEDLDNLPFPSYHKIPMGKYRSAIGAAVNHPSIGMVTSRGCPGRCTFCVSGMFGTKVRFSCPEKIIEHIKFLIKNHRIREISFYDDTFTVNKNRIYELCHRIISEKLNIKWSCFSRIDTISPDILKIMKEAGCHQIMYGFESAKAETLYTMNKKMDPSRHRQIVNWTRKAKIDVRGAFMVGTPNETTEDIANTIEHSIKLGIQYAVYNITTPFPGTELFKTAEKNNTLLHKRWDRYDLSNAILKLPKVTASEVEQLHKQAYKKFYFRPIYIAKRLLSIRSLYEFRQYTKAFIAIVVKIFT